MSPARPPVTVFRHENLRRYALGWDLGLRRSRSPVAR